MDASQLYCLMRAAELQRRRLETLPDRELEQLDQCGQEDLDSLEDETQPYFWNRRR